jgi:phosphatidylglycerophosphate synthase
MNSSESDRRPLKTRSWRVFQRLAAWLANVGVSPNSISVASVFFAAVGAIGLWGTGMVSSDSLRRLCWLLAVAGVQLRLIANLLDGMVAVEGGRGSATGPLYNEVPDRLSDPILLVAAGYAVGSDPIFGWAAAAMALLVAYVRAIAASNGAGQIFVGPMAKPQRMALLTIAGTLGVVLPNDWMNVAGWGVMKVTLGLIVIGAVITVVRRLHRAAEFLRSASQQA